MYLFKLKIEYWNPIWKGGHTHTHKKKCELQSMDIQIRIKENYVKYVRPYFYKMLNLFKGVMILGRTFTILTRNIVG